MEKDALSYLSAEMRWSSFFEMVSNAGDRSFAPLVHVGTGKAGDGSKQTAAAATMMELKRNEDFLSFMFVISELYILRRCRTDSDTALFFCKPIENSVAFPSLPPI